MTSAQITSYISLIALVSFFYTFIQLGINKRKLMGKYGINFKKPHVILMEELKAFVKESKEKDLVLSIQRLFFFQKTLKGIIIGYVLFFIAGKIFKWF